jgi:hypothetical protein
MVKVVCRMSSYFLSLCALWRHALVVLGQEFNHSSVPFSGINMQFQYFTKQLYGKCCQLTYTQHVRSYARDNSMEINKTRLRVELTTSVAAEGQCLKPGFCWLHITIIKLSFWTSSIVQCLKLKKNYKLFPMLNICVFADHKMGETHIWLVPWDAVLLNLWDVVGLLIFSTYDIPLMTAHKTFMKRLKVALYVTDPSVMCHSSSLLQCRKT